MELKFHELGMKDIDEFIKDGFKVYQKSYSRCILKRFTKVYDTGDSQILETVVTIYTDKEKHTKIYIGWLKNG